MSVSFNMIFKEALLSTIFLAIIQFLIYENPTYVEIAQDISLNTLAIIKGE